MLSLFSSEYRKCLAAIGILAIPVLLEGFIVGWRWIPGCAVGALWLVFPPIRVLPRKWKWLAVGLAVSPLLALLPLAAWDGSVWRTAVSATGLSAGSTFLTPQPGRLLEVLPIYYAGLTFAVWLFLVDWTERQRRWLGVGLGLLWVGIMAAVALAQHFDLSWFGGRESGVGPFPSRNQSGLFFAFGALWWGMLAGRFARRSRGLALAGALVAFAGAVAMTVWNGSRAGMGFLLIGLFLQLILGGSRSRLPVRAVLAGFLLAVLAVFAFFFRDSPLLERWRFSSPEDSKGSFRLAVQADTLDLIRDSPLTGVGLGNFDAVFVFYRTRSVSEYRVRHAENDWLHYAAEAGVPAALLLAATFTGLLGMALSRLSRSRSREVVTVSICLLLFAIHLFFDQSGHSPGILFVLLLMLSLVLPTLGQGPPAARFGGRILGVSLILFSVLIFWTTRTLWISRDTADGYDFRPSSDQSLSEIEAALGLNPLAWNLHEMRAHLLLRDGRTNEAAAEFRFARQLEPFSVVMVEREANGWLRAQSPVSAADAAVEMIRRAPASKKLEFYDSYLTRLSSAPAGRSHLLAWEPESTDFEILRWQFLPEAEVRVALERLSVSDGSLDAYSERKLMRLAAALGGLGEVERVAIRTGGWRSETWWLAAEEFAGRQDFKAASWIVLRHLSPPLPPTEPLATLQQKWSAAPSDPLNAFPLARAYLGQGEVGAVRRVIDRVEKRDESSPMLNFYAGWAAYLEGDFPSAWTFFKAGVIKPKGAE